MPPAAHQTARTTAPVPQPRTSPEDTDGVAALQTGLSAREGHRRATPCLTAARSVGAGQVIRYRGIR
ncbi:hypothetical protein [Modestobacter lapidis]|nr:hypothetical protein [Modestobacter lapidis]